MALAMEILTEIELDEARGIVANDGARSSFTVRSGDSLLALDADLTVIGRWPVGRLDGGCHATAPGSGLALISGGDEVRLVDRQGGVRWRHRHRHRHRSWGGDDSGCAWFGPGGEPHAIVPGPDDARCLVLRLDLDSGRPVAQALAEAWVTGYSPIHHPSGWVGVSGGVIQEGSRAWWTRSRRQPGGDVLIETFDAGWDDQILFDVDSDGAHVVTVMYPTGPILVRSFPDLRIRRTIELPRFSSGWQLPVFFAGDLVLANASGYGLVAFGEDGSADVLNDEEGGWLIPAAHGTWLTVTGNTIRRAKIAGWPSEPPSAIPLF